MRADLTAIVAIGLSIAGTPATAACFRNCLTAAQHKPSSVIPADNSFARFGDLFSGQFTSLALRGDQSAQVGLGFDVRIGSGLFNSVNINENGFLSFTNAVSRGIAVDGGFIPVKSLSELGDTVIAPFYADLAAEDAEGKEPQIGQVIVEYGAADPTADVNGQYSKADLTDAVRITWYGLPVVSFGDALNARDATPRAFAQVLLTKESDKGDFNFEFRSGDPETNGGKGPFSQPGYGSIAGFSLNGTVVQFSGPYDGIGEPDYFVFRDGEFQPAAAVPEPATWGMMMLGIGAAAAALRRRRTAEAARA